MGTMTLLKNGFLSGTERLWLKSQIELMLMMRLYRKNLIRSFTSKIIRIIAFENINEGCYNGIGWV